MSDYLEKLPDYVDDIQSMMEIIITNLVLIGQIPAQTFEEKARCDHFLERLAEFQVDECTTDGYNNPIGIIRGTSRSKPPIFLVAHLDTPFGRDVDHHFTVRKKTISGAGLLDNSLGAAVLISMPEILRKLDIRLSSDLVLAGVIQSIGKGNLRGIRHLLKTWSSPIRGAVCIESGELGRLNYYSHGMIRGEIQSHIDRSTGYPKTAMPNAILVLNEVINQIMELRLPLKPKSKVIFGTIHGGLKHGDIAHDATLGFEIQSDTDDMVKSIYSDIKDIIAGIHHEYEVDLKMETISNQRAARLRYNHPLVKNVVAIMEKLKLQPLSDPSESELSIFLSRRIPAVTLGVTKGKHYQQKDATMEIQPMFKGIAQIIGAIIAIDNGVCDEQPVD